MENHNTGTINSSARYCLAKPGDKVRITKTHRAGIEFRVDNTPSEC